MKNTLYIFLLLLTLNVNGQQAISSISDYDEEKVFLHLNTTTALAGETLFYSAYTFLKDINSPSTLSKILYVAILDEDKNIIKSQKVGVLDGKAQGEIFLDTNIPSGNYAVIAYTLWMLNASSETYFQTPLNVINPYNGDQGDILTVVENPVKIELQKSVSNNTNTSLNITPSVAGKRQKVTVSLSKNLEADLSISVRKLDVLSRKQEKTSLDFASTKFEKVNIQNIEKLIVPEIRGEVINGKIYGQDNANVTSSKKVALSIPDDNLNIQVASTVKDGEFFFVLDEPYDSQYASVVVLDDKDYEVTLNPTPTPNFTDLRFKDFKITNAQNEAILKRSVANQVENAYFALKPDTLVVEAIKDPFYNSKGVDVKKYDLDAYTRFNTVRETFIEIIENAAVRRIDQELRFRVFLPDLGVGRGEGDPLLIVDGIIQKDPSAILSYPSRNIEEITVVREEYNFGPNVFFGMLIINTKDEDFKKTYYSSSSATAAKIGSIDPAKKYFKQQYSNGNNKRTPDYRYQLLWEPHADFKDKKTFEFFTSDISGTYEIVIQGFTKNGKPVYITQYFEVN